MDGIVLNENDILVKPVEDYFKKTDDFTITENVNHSVGIIKHVGEKIDKSWVDKIIYYHKNIGTVINLKGIGRFDLIDNSVKLIVRMDQNSDNY